MYSSGDGLSWAHFKALEDEKLRYFSYQKKEIKKKDSCNVKPLYIEEFFDDTSLYKEAI